jgi:hypothetical protein
MSFQGIGSHFLHSSEDFALTWQARRYKGANKYSNEKESNKHANKRIAKDNFHTKPE